MLPPSAAVPSGVAVKVIAVTKDTAGATLITYSQPALNEVFKNLNLRLRQNLTTADIQGASIPQGVSVVSTGVTASGRESGQGTVLPGGISSLGDAFKIKYAPFNSDTGAAAQAKVINKGQWIDAITGDQVQRSSNLLLGSNIGFELKDLVLLDADGKYLTNGGANARDASGRYISVSDATTGDQLRLSGEVFIKNSAFDVDINVLDYAIKRAGARFNGTLETKLVFDTGLKETFSLTDITGELDNSLSIGDWFRLKGIDFGKERIVLGSINIGVSAAGLPVIVPGVGNSITTLPLAIVVSVSIGMNGKIDATASFGADYKAYFDKGAYYSTNSSGELAEEKKYDIVAHGDTPNPNVPNAAAATAAELARKPEFRTFVKGQATINTKSQIGIDASLAIAGMIPLQLNNALQIESDLGMKGRISGTSDRPGQFDIVGCGEIRNKASLVSTLYVRLVGESDWLTIDGIDKKRALGTYVFFSEGIPMTCTQQLGVDFIYEVNPADIQAPPAGQYKVRFKPDAQWKALTAAAVSGKADVDTWGWTFGDTSLGNLLGNADENPVHTYSAAGTYSVELKIKDSYGQSAKILKTLVLGTSTVPSTTATTPTITTTLAVPATPSFGGFANSSSAITLSWAAVNQATYYQLLRNTVQISGNVTNLFYVDTGITAKTDYSYQLKACNATGCSAASVAYPLATASTTATITSTIAAGFTSSTNGWCNQEVTFTNNAIPANWSQQLIRGGPGVGNNRLEASPTDNGAAIVGNSITMASSVKQIIIEYSATHLSSFWGMTSGINLQTANGAWWLASFVNASFAMPSDQIRFDVSKGPTNALDGSSPGRVGAAASGGGFTSGFSYGIQRVKYVITDGQIKLTVTNQANNSQANSTVTLISGFLVADVVAPLFYVYTTSGSSAWGDDLRISCNP